MTEEEFEKRSESLADKLYSMIKEKVTDDSRLDRMVGQYERRSNDSATDPLVRRALKKLVARHRRDN